MKITKVCMRDKCAKKIEVEEYERFDNFFPLFCDVCWQAVYSIVEMKTLQTYKEFIQPERSKREDLINLLNDICNNCLNDKYLLDIVHIGNDSSLECLLKDIKMRCSEHCGNAVRGK